jgi:hypothetical protein
MLLSGGISLSYYYRDFRKSEIREATTYILRHSGAGDAAACVQTRFGAAVSYYLLGRKYPLVSVPLDELAQGLPNAAGITREQTAAALRKCASVWVIEIDDPWSRDANRIASEWLRGFMRPVQTQPFYEVRLVRYVPLAGDAGMKG